jgi:hypothetical protein
VRYRMLDRQEVTASSASSPLTPSRSPWPPRTREPEPGNPGAIALVSTDGRSVSTRAVAPVSVPPSETLAPRRRPSVDAGRVVWTLAASPG